MYFLCPEKRRKEEADRRFVKISAGICIQTFDFGGSCFQANYFVLTATDSGVRNPETPV